MACFSALAYEDEAVCAFPSALQYIVIRYNRDVGIAHAATAIYFPWPCNKPMTKSKAAAVRQLANEYFSHDADKFVTCQSFIITFRSAKKI